MNKLRLVVLLWALVFLTGCEMRSQVTDNERPKIGLVLGGGGAKGAAEVGVLKVMEAVGINPDYIAGTSIGSILGGLYANGYSAAELDTLMRSQDWLTLIGDRNTNYKRKLVSEDSSAYYIFGFPVLRKKKNPDTNGVGMLRGDHILELLDSCTNLPDSLSFDDLPIPFRCVAYDLKANEEVVLDRGNLPLSIRASMAIPGAFKPVRIQNKVLLDGGLINNLPVDVVREMGADIVIAVDLTQNKRQPSNLSLESGGLLDWLLTRPDLDSADIYINPDLDGYGVTSFSQSNIATMIEIGEIEAWKYYNQFNAVKNGSFKRDEEEIKARHKERNNDENSKKGNE